MYISEISKTIFIFLFIYFGVINLGNITNKLILKEKNNTDLNIVLGFLSLSFFSGFLLVFKIFSISVILIFISLSYFAILFNKKILENKILFNDKIILFLLGIIFIISLKNNFNFADDLGGYFKTINDFIYKTNLYNNELQYRLYYSYPFYLILNSIFISFSDFYSAWFLDVFFGSSLILFTLKNNFKFENKFIFLILTFTVLMTVVTIQETNTPKLISIGLILIILFELEKFYHNNKYLLSLLLFSSLLIIFKFTNIASYTNLMIALILIEKIYKKKIKIKEFILPIFLSLIIFLPWAIYSIQIFNSPLTALFPSQYYYTQNEFFKNLNLQYIHETNLLTYIYSRQILITLLLSVIYFFISKKKKFFKLCLIFSFFMCFIFFLTTMFSDKSNFLRYMNQFFVSYSAFLIFKIFEEILKKKINLKSYIMIVMLCLITIRVNQNITVFIGNSLNNVQYLFTRNYERYYKKINIISARFLGKEIVIDKIYPENYKQNIEKIFKFTDDKFGKTLMVVSKPYLFNFKKNGNNVEYIEYQFGYSLTKTPYPIFENKDKRIEYLKNRKIKYFLIEKKYINHKNGLVKKFIDKKQNVIIDNQGREKGSHELTAFYDDLMDLLLNNIPKKVINQNETFIVYELKL